MKKIIRLILALVVIVPVALATLIFVVPQQIDWSARKDTVQSFLKDKTGYNIELVGNFALSTWPEPSVELDGLRVAAFNGKRDLFTAENIRLELSARKLAQLGLGIKTFTMEKPMVYLNVDASGIENWLPKRTKRRGSSGSSDLSFIRSLGETVISNGGFLYENEVNGQRYEMVDLQVSVEGRELGEGQLSAEAKLNDIPVAMNFNLDMSDFDEIPLKGDASLGLTVVHVEGVLEDALAKASYEGSLNVNGEDLFENVYNIVNIPPEQRSFTAPIYLKTKLDTSPKEILVDEFELSLNGGDKGVLKGNVEFQPKQRRKKGHLEVSIYADENLDLNDLGICKEDDDSSNKPASKGAPWSDALIDMSSLESMNAKIEFKTKAVMCGAASVDAIDVIAKVGKGKVTLDRAQITQGEGTLDVTGAMNLKNNLSTNVDVVLANLPIEKFLSADQQKNMNAPVNGFVKLNFKGKTTREWASNLNGRIEMKSDNMHLKSFALDKLAFAAKSFFGQSSGESKLKGKKASFLMALDVENGVVKTDTFNLKTGEGSVLGKGKIDLVNWKINYRLIPGEDIKLGVSIPVRVQGDLSSPLIAPDLTSPQGIGAGIGAAVGGPLGAGVGAAVGTMIQGEGGEAKKKVEDAAKDLMGIFGR